MQRPVKRTRDAEGWRRCSEGFIDFFANNVETNKDASRRRKSIDNQQHKESFAPGNIFEKLALPLEDSGQSIAWSSSENEEEQKIVEPVKKRKKLSPKPATRRTRSSLRQQRCSTEDKDVEILSNSDTEKDVHEQGTQDTNAAVTLSGKSEAASIRGYESDPEVAEVFDRAKTPPASQEPDSQSSAVISTPSSVETQSGIGVKASDWIKSLQLKTPSKTDQTAEVSGEVEDSARKKKKHCRGGFAEQLTRLQNRDKSSVRVWKHQLSTLSFSQGSRFVCMEVIGFEHLYSLQLVRCRVVTTEIVTQTGTQTETGAIANDSGIRLVMIPASQAEQLKLQVGMIFKIYPPWQQLELNTGQQIMLCTKYCHVVEQAGSQGIVDEKPAVDEIQDGKVALTVKWNCPCIQGLCTSQRLCPAYQFPCIPGYLQDLEDDGEIKAQEVCNSSNTPLAAGSLASMSSSVTAINSRDTLSAFSSNTVKTHLHTVGLRTPGSRDKLQCSVSSGSNIFDSILESIEYDKSRGDDHTPSLSFKGHVHKKVPVRDGKVLSYHLFVEDVVGTVCVIKLSSSTLWNFKMEDDCIEGKTFQFTGVRVGDRVTRERDPQVLSMVDKLWSGTVVNKMTSQDTEGETLETIKTEEPVGFCYVLEESQNATVDMLPCLVDLYPERQQTIQCLSDILKPAGKCFRCDCLVRIIHLQNSDKDKQQLKQAFVIDTSRNIPVLIKFQGTKKVFNFTTKSTADVCKFIKDLYVFKGEFIFDDYTTVVNNTDGEFLEKYKETLTNLCEVNAAPETVTKQSRIDDIISVAGVICEVDEESAYSWEACKACGSDQIQIDSKTGRSKCNDCKETMDDVDVKMKMEVIVKVRHSDLNMKIDLLQSTIESLLPKDEEDEDGYELSSVLNKSIGPLNCLVVEKGQNWAFFLQEIELLS